LESYSQKFLLRHERHDSEYDQHQKLMANHSACSQQVLWLYEAD
jgi:hypothetical protein